MGRFLDPKMGAAFCVKNIAEAECATREHVSARKRACPKLLVVGRSLCSALVPKSWPSADWGGPSTRPQIWSGFWTQFWGLPAQCFTGSLRQVAKPKRRSAPIELQTKAVWPNVRGVIFVARDTGIQGPYSATPPVR